MLEVDAYDPTTTAATHDDDGDAGNHSDSSVPSDWLCADAVDTCCQVLVTMCTSPTVDNGSVVFVSSLAITAALNRLDTPNSTQNSVRRAMGIKKNRTWPPRDMACFSINSGSHWSLLAYFPEHDSARIYHYDSGRHFPCGGNAAYARRVVTMMARVRLVPDWVQLAEDTRFPTQDGGIECGYYLIAAMANMLWHRRERLNMGRRAVPMDFYNMDLLQSYGLSKLRKIVQTLLFRNRENQKSSSPSRGGINRNHRERRRSSQEHQQQTTRDRTISGATFSFDDYCCSSSSSDTDAEKESKRPPDDDDDDDRRIWRSYDLKRGAFPAPDRRRSW